MDNNYNGLENMNANQIPTPVPTQPNIDMTSTPSIGPIEQPMTTPVETVSFEQPIIMEPAVNEPDFAVPTMNNNEIPMPPSFTSQEQQVSQDAMVAPAVAPTESQMNIGEQSTEIVQTQETQPIEQNVQQQNGTMLTSDDDELIKAYIGKNYEKIIEQKFNIPAFFLKSLYMFYRKMFLYGLGVFLAGLILSTLTKNMLIGILVSILVGLFGNKLYVYNCKQKIAKIKVQNPGKNIEELKAICSNKGGTSVGLAVLGSLITLAISIVFVIIMLIAGIGNFIGEFLNIDDWKILLKGDLSNTGGTQEIPSDAILLENIELNGYSCFGGCIFYINDGEYTYAGNDVEYFQNLSDYSEYIKVDILYKEVDGRNKIFGYKVYVKSTSEEITSIKNENELREKLGLYTLGKHTETLTLKEIGTPGFGYVDEETHNYIDYVFVNSKNIELEMRYKYNDKQLDLVVGNQYEVSFEAIEGTFHIEYEIISVS